MAPQAIQAKGKAGGDLRMFFGGSGQGGKKVAAVPASSFKTGTQKKDAIEINDDERPNQKQKSSPNISRVNKADSDDEPESPKLSTVTRRRKIATIASDDEEDDLTPVNKKRALETLQQASGGKPAKPAPRPSISNATKGIDYDEDFQTHSPEENTASESDAQREYKNVKAQKVVKTKGKPSKTNRASSANASNRSEAAKQRPSSSTKNLATQDKTSHFEAKKFNWAAAKAAKLAGPVAHGSKEVPNGSPNCLAGLSFVFTGELSSFSREEAVDLAKRFGGRVVLQPSSKTDFVVLGDNAGPSKVAAITKHKLNTLSEDEFLEMIATRKGPDESQLDAKTRKKLEKERDEIKKAAREMEKREQMENVAVRSGKVFDPSSQLWTSRYAPQSIRDICGNKGQVEKLLQWLQDWPSSLKSGFKKPGKVGMNVFRAVLISGSPGIGKTTSAHLCAKLAGFTPIELNASDTRSKKLVESGMNINNTSLDSYIKGNHDTNSLGVTITDKTCLIMDEVDGMSAGDRGGVGALNALIKKTKIPIICIANERQAQKLRPLMSTTFHLPFHKPQVNAIRSRILTIAFKEKMKIPANVLDQLVTGAQSDIRQVLNMLSIWKLSSNTMDFDEGKALAKMNEKYAMMSPFDITSKVLGPYLFSPTSRETLGDKMELYFQDHAFVPLFIQENYLKTEPAKLRNIEGPEKTLTQMHLMDRAASSISDADLVDALIHGPEQHWTLMPLHAVCSTVRPASFQYGTGAHYGGPNAMSFPQWLGQNSKQAKLVRQLGDVQIRMRLKVSGDKSEIRQSYIPALFPYIVKPLADEGVSVVDEVIKRMDDYYLSKEDWDTVVELGVGDRKDDIVLKSIPSATKSALTRTYNSSEHPIPFHKAQDLGRVPKKLPSGSVPDLEEAFLDDMEEDVSEEEETKKDPGNLMNDKFIAPKRKRAPAGAKAKGKANN